ncbi:MAG: hypothetical protein ACM3ZC_01410 [Bacteroidota bacterium]
MKPLKISISGVRGVVGAGLGPELAARFAASFATYVGGGPVLLARDGRSTGLMLRGAVAAGLIASGAEVVDLGICSTAVTQFLTPLYNAKGAVIISGGHNPADWNALMFVRADGRFLDRYQGGELLDIFHANAFRHIPGDGMLPIRHAAHPVGDYLDAVLQRVDLAPLARRPFRVAVDCGNGSASLVAPELLRRIGCEVLALYAEPIGEFARSPEPTPASLTALRSMLRSNQADIGFAFDPDGTRVVVVDERGEIPPEDATLLLVLRGLLPGTSGETVVASYPTSCAVETLAAGHGARVVRCRTGDVHVIEAMVNEGAIAGGEGNGGVVVPSLHLAEDGFCGMLAILSLLAREERPVSALLAELPPVRIQHRNLACAGLQVPALMQRVRAAYEGEDCDLADGVRVVRPTEWFQVRAANTEPVLRLTAEAETVARSLTILAEITELLWPKGGE